MAAILYNDCMRNNDKQDAKWCLLGITCKNMGLSGTYWIIAMGRVAKF